MLSYIVFYHYTEKSLLHLGFKDKEIEVTQSCPTLWDTIDCNLPGYPVHGIFQAKVLEWVAISFSRGSSRPRHMNPGLPHCRQTLYHLSHQGSPKELNFFLILWHKNVSNSNKQVLNQIYIFKSQGCKCPKQKCASLNYLLIDAKMLLRYCFNFIYWLVKFNYEIFELYKVIQCVCIYIKQITHITAM